MHSFADYALNPHSMLMLAAPDTMPQE